ncbi:MAG: hypothetical protein K9L56_13295 [Clostridiales bacterium]|nr:hypothetical protein [Clostridiales bacterium]
MNENVELEQKEVEVAGNKYIIQHPGYEWYLSLIDKNCPPNAVVPKQLPMMKAYLKHVVVKPRDLKINDFQSKKDELGGMPALRKLSLKCERFLSGRE